MEKATSIQLMPIVRDALHYYTKKNHFKSYNEALLQLLGRSEMPGLDEPCKELQQLKKKEQYVPGSTYTKCPYCRLPFAKELIPRDVKEFKCVHCGEIMDVPEDWWK